MLTASQLSLMRSAQERLMPDTATILERTLTADGRGGKTATYAERATVKCRLAFYGNRPTYPDNSNGEFVKSPEKYLLSLPVGTEIATTDRIKVKGVTYEILSPSDDGASSDALTGGRSFQTALRLLVQPI